MPGRPGPLAHAVEALAVLHLVAVDELLVGEDVAVRVHDALREPGRPRRVVELRRVVGRGVGADEVGRRARRACPARGRACPAPTAGRTAARSAASVTSSRAPESESRCSIPSSPYSTDIESRIAPSFQTPKKIAAASGVGGSTTATRSPRSTPRAGERVRRPVREVLQLAPDELPRRAVEALPDHRRLVARMLVAHVGGDVVPRRHLPAVGRADLVVAARAHRRDDPIIARTDRCLST